MKTTTSKAGSKISDRPFVSDVYEVHVPIKDCSFTPCLKLEVRSVAIPFSKEVHGVNIPMKDCWCMKSAAATRFDKFCCESSSVTLPVVHCRVLL